MNKLRFLVLSFLSLSLLCLVLPSKIFAQELPTIGANLNTYVPPTGAECTINVPSQYSTIQGAINAASSGSTICVDSGIYNENLVIGKSIRLSGRGSNKSTINGQSQIYDIYGVSTVVFPNSSENSITLEGFRIIGAGTTYRDVSVLLLGSSLGAKIQYNYIVSGNNGYALNAAWIRSNDIIQNNIFEGNNSNQVAAFSHDGSSENYQILNNTFTGTVLVNNSVSDSGVVFKFGGKNSVIKHNVFSTSGIVNQLMQVTYTPNIVTENNFNSPTNIKLVLSGNTIVLNAQNNWWGDIDPSDNIGNINTVDYSNFALSPFPEYPLPPPNQSPVITSISPISSVLPGTQINASATFTDPDTADIHTATWNWGDGNTTTGNITESNGSGTVTGSHSYASPGTYTVTLTVSDGTDSVSATTSITILTPVQATNNIIDTVQTFNLQQGISNSLDAKLSSSVDSLNDLNNHNDAAAINSLQAFINAVNAQSGNKITTDQANTLISLANTLIAYLSP